MTTSRFTKPAQPKVRKTARKPTTKVEAVHDFTAQHDAQRQYAEATARAQDEYLARISVPSHTRQLVASVSQLIVFSASFYWGVYATGWLMFVAATATTSAFLTFVVGLVTTLLALKASWDASTAAAEFISNFKLENAADIGRDLRIAAAKRVNLVKGWFKRDDAMEAQHA